jgi:tetratricopeptide (TPR) repeat protein
VQEAWLAKLGHWGEALRMYDARLLVTPKDGMAIAGKLKCLDALGRWEEAIQLCIENLDHLRAEGGPGGSITHSKAAVIGARAAWSLNGWGLMDNIVSQLPSDNIDASFMRAVIAVHKENYEEAAALIEQTRRHLDGGIRALLAESYGRAYVPLIMVQQCSELEEITEYKMLLREAGMSTPVAALDCQTDSSSILGGNVRRLSISGEHSRRNSNASLGQLSQIGSPPCDDISGMNGRGSIAHLTTSVPRSPRSHGMSSRSSGNSGGCISPTPIARSGSGGGCISAPPGLESSSGETAFNPNDANIQALRAEAVRRKAHLAEKWRQRIRGCCSSGRAAIPVWKYLLNGRRMVLSEREDLDTWLEFASLCRNGGNTALAERVLNMSQKSASIAGGGGLGDETNASMDRRVRFALLKQQWAVSDRKPALMGLDALIRSASTGWESSGRGSYSGCGSNLAQVDSAVYLGEC